MYLQRRLSHSSSWSWRNATTGRLQALLCLALQLQSHTIYHDEWYELLNAQTNRPSITDKEARKKYDARIKTFLDASAAVISFGDVPWPCDGDAQDKVALMLKGEETPGAKIRRLKTIALFWHPDKFLSRYFKRLREENREGIIESNFYIIINAKNTYIVMNDFFLNISLLFRFLDDSALIVLSFLSFWNLRKGIRLKRIK